jgi:hypothetical protein
VGDVGYANRQPPLVPLGTGDGPQSPSTWVSGLLGHLQRVASWRASASDDAEEPEEASARRESAWAVYLRQSAVRVALADALLYLTVMSGGLLMTAYLKWLGLSEAALALWRGFAALAGVAATYIFPPLRRYKGTPCCRTPLRRYKGTPCCRTPLRRYKLHPALAPCSARRPECTVQEPMLGRTHRSLFDVGVRSKKVPSSTWTCTLKCLELIDSFV